MINNVLQSCYTNNVISDQADSVRTTGWQSVAISKDIPADAFLACEKMQGRYSNFSSDLFSDSTNIFDVHSDDKYVYISRIQYGLHDFHGRPSMFAHTYIMTWNQNDLLERPGLFLTIENDNFKTSEKEALEWQESLHRFDIFPLQDTLDELDIDPGEYIELVKCVYAKLNFKNLSMTPLYVQYDGTDIQMRKILFCIYKALPHYLRKKITVSSCDSINNEHKALVFSTNARKYELYIDPKTAENNVLTDRFNKIIDNDGFITYAVSNYRESNMEEYFNALNKEAVALGDSSASDRMILRLAHQMLLGRDVKKLNDVKLLKTLSDFISVEIEGTEILYKHIASLIYEVCERDLELTKELEAKINELQSKRNSDSIDAIMKTYEFKKFNRLSVAEAAKLLSSYREEKQNQYIELLLDEDKGVQILEEFFINYKLKYANTWEDVDIIGNNSRQLMETERYGNAFMGKAFEYYSRLMSEDITMETYYAFMNIVNKYIHFLDIKTIEDKAKSVIWDNISFRKISFDKKDVYYALSVKTELCKMYIFYVKLAVEGAVECNEKKLLDLVNGYFIKYASFIKDDEREYIVNSLINEWPWVVEKEQTRKAFYIASLISAERNYNRFSSIYNLVTTVEDINNNYYIALQSNYDSFVERVNTEIRRAEIKTQLNEFLLAVFKKKDVKFKPISVDIWLMIGSNIYNNPFEIFDAKLPYILDVEDFNFLEDSALLRKTSYQRDAEEYVKQKTEAGKIIKEWLSEIKKISRDKIKKDDKKLNMSRNAKDDFIRDEIDIEDQIDSQLSPSYSEIMNQVDSVSDESKAYRRAQAMDAPPESYFIPGNEKTPSNLEDLNEKHPPFKLREDKKRIIEKSQIMNDTPLYTVPTQSDTKDAAHKEKKSFMGGLFNKNKKQ